MNLFAGVNTTFFVRVLLCGLVNVLCKCHNYIPYFLESDATATIFLMHVLVWLLIKGGVYLRAALFEEI